MNINVGDYLMAIDEIPCVSYQWNHLCNTIIKRFKMFEIIKIYKSNDKYDALMDDFSVVTINESSLKGKCVKLKVEEI